MNKLERWKFLMPLTLAVLFVAAMVSGAWANEFAAAPEPIISYGATVNVPNNTMAPGEELGDIVVTSPVGGDIVLNSTIVVEAPADTKFADAGIPATTGAVAVSTGVLSAGNTKVTYTVTNGSLATDTVTIGSLELIAKDPTKTSLNVNNLHLTITANSGTSAPTTGEFGTIRLVQVPTLVKAVLVSGTAIDLCFNTDVAADASHDAFADNELKHWSYDKTFEASWSVTTSRLALDYNAVTKPDGSKKLVHVTAMNGSVGVGDTVTLRRNHANGGSGDVDNALTVSGGTPVNQGIYNGTPVYIQPQDVAISAVTITDTDKTYGVHSFQSKNIIDATVVANPGTQVTLRLKTADGLNTVDAYEDDTFGVEMSSSDSDVDGYTLTIPSSGTAHITLELSDDNGLNAVAPDTKVTEGIILEASTSGFVEEGTAAADTITVDRKKPSVVLTSGKAIDNNTLEVTFTESIVEATGITPDNYYLNGDNWAADISYVELSDDAKTATLHTSLLSAATNNRIEPDHNITDLVGNHALSTQTNEFNTAGQALTSVSLMSVYDVDANPSTFVTKVTNGARLNVHIEGPTALSQWELEARAVDASDPTFVIGAAVWGFTEKSVGVYEPADWGPRIDLADPISSSVTAIIIQASTDSFVTYVESGPIDVDTTRPKVASASAAGAKGVNVVFTEPVSKGDAEDDDNYEITGTGGVPDLSIDELNLQPDGKTVLITTTDAQVEGATYTVNVQGSIYDAADNEILDIDALTIDMANFIGVAADTEAPIFEDPVVSSDYTEVTITIIDKPDANPSGVDLANSQITGFYKDGFQVSGTATKTEPNVLVFRPAAPLEEGACYQITVRAQDYAGNQNLETLSFTTEGAAPQDPPTETNVSECDAACQATAPVTATGVNFSYTAGVTILVGAMDANFQEVWWLNDSCEYTHDFAEAASGEMTLSCTVDAPPDAAWLFWFVTAEDLDTLDWENGAYDLLFYSLH